MLGAAAPFTVSPVRPGAVTDTPVVSSVLVTFLTPSTGLTFGSAAPKAAMVAAVLLTTEVSVPAPG